MVINIRYLIIIFLILFISGCSTIQKHSKERFRSEERNKWPVHMDYPPNTNK